MLDFHFSVTADVEELTELVTQLREVVMADLTRLKEAVARIEDRGDAAIALIRGLAEEIRNNATDEVALRDLADKMEVQASELDQAVIENTPTEPDPENPPE